MKQVIPSEEVVFHPLSFQDEAGRLFQWRGALHRGISAQSAAFLRRFFENGSGRELIAAGLLIPTETTPFALDGFDLVLRHHLLPFPSYPFEWCPAMFKAACLTIMNLQLALARHDLTLKDAHPWNVLFDGTCALWIDVTSIEPANGRTSWAAESEFYDNCLHPLLLMAQGREKLARAIIAETEVVQRSDLELLGGSRSLVVDLTTALLSRLPEPKRRIVRKNLRPLRSVLQREKSTAAEIPLLSRLEQIQREVERIEVPFAGQNLSHPALPPNDKWDARIRSIAEILCETKPRTVLDIASGSGWCSELAAQIGAEVVAFDSDPEAVARLFANARAHDISVLPLIIDFTRPSPARGLANHCHIAASERFACEMVLMLGFLHDLVFRYRRLGLNEISDGLALFTKRWLVVEFIPGTDPEVGPLLTDWFSGYTLENFQRSLRRHFSRIELRLSQPNDRVLLFCER